MSIRDVQDRLTGLGFNPGKIDGVYGQNTEDAILAALWSLDVLRQKYIGEPSQRTSRRGVAAIAAHEGFVPGPYRDVKGIWTCYVGHTASAGEPDPETLPVGMPVDVDLALREGMRVFRRDLATFEDRVRRAFTRPLKQHQFDAAVSFDFNTGGILTAAWVKSHNAGDEAKAAREIMNWLKPIEIKERRESEQRLYRDGTYPDKPMHIWRVDAAGRVLWGFGPLRTCTPDEVADMMRRV